MVLLGLQSCLCTQRLQLHRHPLPVWLYECRSTTLDRRPQGTSESCLVDCYNTAQTYLFALPIQIPALGYAVYQMMFATVSLTPNNNSPLWSACTNNLPTITCRLIQITPMIVLGAIAERGRIAPALVFSFVWSTLVYDPIAVSSALDNQLPSRAYSTKPMKFSLPYNSAGHGTLTVGLPRWAPLILLVEVPFT